MKLLFTGDINFRGLAKPTPKTSTDIFAEVFPYFEKEDFRIVNLETPLANKDKSRFTKQVFLCKSHDHQPCWWLAIAPLGHVTR